MVTSELVERLCSAWLRDATACYSPHRRRDGAEVPGRGVQHLLFCSTISGLRRGQVRRFGRYPRSEHGEEGVAAAASSRHIRTSREGVGTVKRSYVLCRDNIFFCSDLQAS